jgi:hypothetical protein
LANIDGEVLLEQAERHGLVHGLFRHAQALGLPPDVRTRVADLHRAKLQVGLQLTAVLGEVVELLTAHGLTALPYKGPALSAQLFGDPALREATDLDILVPEAQAPQCYALLTQHGFVPVRPYARAVLGQLFQYRAELGLMRAGVLLELQWRLAPRYFSVDLDIAAIAARAGTLAVGSRQIPQMAAEDTLLVLAIHAAKHQWSSLKWVLDIDLLIRRYPTLDWNTVMERAKEAGTLRILLTTLFISRELLFTPLPEEIIERMTADRAVGELGQAGIVGIGSGKEDGERQHHSLMLRLRERRRDRLRYMARLAYQPTESEWDTVRLPAGFAWGYYGLRVARVLLKALRAPFS